MRTMVARELLLTQAAQQDCWTPCYVAQFGIGRNKKPGTFPSRFASYTCNHRNNTSYDVYMNGKSHYTLYI